MGWWALAPRVFQSPQKVSAADHVVPVTLGEPKNGNARAVLLRMASCAACFGAAPEASKACAERSQTTLSVLLTLSRSAQALAPTTPARAGAEQDSPVQQPGCPLVVRGCRRRRRGQAALRGSAASIRAVGTSANLSRFASQPLAKSLRVSLRELCDRIEARCRGVAMLDVQIRVRTARACSLVRRGFVLRLPRSSSCLHRRPGRRRMTPTAWFSSWRWLTTAWAARGPAGAPGCRALLRRGRRGLPSSLRSRASRCRRAACAWTRCS